MEFNQSNATQRTMSGTQSSISPLFPGSDRAARAQKLTPAQKRALAFAQQQVVRVKQAQKAKIAHQAEILRMQQSEDKDFEASLNVGSHAQNSNEQGAVISFRRVLGEVLRELRTRDKKTLREVSQRAGVSLGYLSEVERGQKEASSELLGSIAAALGMSLSQTLRLVADQIEKLEGVNTSLSALS